MMPQATSAATAAPISAHAQPGRPPPPEELGVVALVVVELGGAELDVVELDCEEPFFAALTAAAAAAAAAAA